jgi:hypothetical protein
VPAPLGPPLSGVGWACRNWTRRTSSLEHNFFLLNPHFICNLYICTFSTLVGGLGEWLGKEHSLVPLSGGQKMSQSPVVWWYREVVGVCVEAVPNSFS